MGFFDLSNRYTGLDAKNDPLAKIDEVLRKVGTQAVGLSHSDILAKEPGSRSTPSEFRLTRARGRWG